MYKLKNIIGILGILALVSSGIFIFAGQVFSSEEDKVTGFAWGANDADNNGFNPLIDGGIGWVSFNCTNPGSNCAPPPNGSPYGVDVIPDPSDPENFSLIDGYAWSSNFGWLRFNNVGPNYPVGNGVNGTSATEARINLNNGEVSGWIRFCGIFASGCNNNSPLLDNSFRGGWDGWVSLRGGDVAGDTYGVEVDLIENVGAFSGQAWSGGSDGFGNNNVTGAGWIYFSGNNIGVFWEQEAAGVDLSASTNYAPIGGSATLSWNGSGIEIGENCIGIQGDPVNTAWTTVQQDSPDGTFLLTNLPAGLQSYRIQCEGAGGPVLSNFVTIQVGANLTLNAFPNPAQPGNNWQVELSWEHQPTTASLTNCVADTIVPPNADGVTGWHGGLVLGNSPSVNPIEGIYIPEEPPSGTTFKITCYDENNQPIEAVTTVTRSLNAIAEINLYNTEVIAGKTTLSWNPGNLDYVVGDGNSGSCLATDNAPLDFGNTGWSKANGEFLVGDNLPAYLEGENSGAVFGDEIDILVPTTTELSAMGSTYVCPSWSNLSGQLGTLYTISCESEVDPGEIVSSSVCLNQNGRGNVIPRIIED